MDRCPVQFYGIFPKSPGLDFLWGGDGALLFAERKGDFRGGVLPGSHAGGGAVYLDLRRCHGNFAGVPGSDFPAFRSASHKSVYAFLSGKDFPFRMAGGAGGLPGAGDGTLCGVSSADHYGSLCEIQFSR